MREQHDLGPCPKPYTRSTATEIGQLPESIGRDTVVLVAVSWFDVRLVATSIGVNIYLSTDEGHSFHRVRDTAAGTPIAMAFDCHGRLHVVRESSPDTIQIGTYDDGAADVERWTELHQFTRMFENGAKERAPIELVPYDTSVAVIGEDAYDPDRGRLVILRADARGRWQSQPLWKDNYLSWDGITIDMIGPAAGRDRIRMRVTPWQGGECGYSGTYDVTANLRTLNTAVRAHGEEGAPELPSRIEQMSSVVRDVAGRWLGIDTSGKEYRLVRLTDAERLQRVNRAYPRSRIPLDNRR